jgi:DUF2939 family protein
MPVAPVKSSQRPKLMIRRGRKVTEGVEVQAVFADIRSGQLKPKHEFSTDGVNWRRLDSHPQLARVFATAPEPETKKKGPLIFLLLIILMVVATGLYFHPYLAFYNIQTAVDSRNVQKLSEWVDYSGLHQDVKSQLDVQWSEVSASQISDTPYAKVAEPAGRAQVDKMIDALITPEAVMGFAKGEIGLIGSWADGSSEAPIAGDLKDPLADLGLSMESVNKALDSVNGVLAQGELHYTGFSSFVATIKADNGESFDFMYERKGIGWKLSGITLPLEPVRSSVNDIAQSILKDARAKARATNKNKKNKDKKGEKDKKSKKDKRKPVQVAKLTSGKKAYMANLQLRNLTVGKGKRYLFGSPNPGIFAVLKNKGNRTLNEVEITVYFYNGKGAIVSEKKLYPVTVSKYRPGRDNDPLEPQKAKKVSYLVKEFAPPSWAGKVQMRVTDIIFKE